MEKRVNKFVMPYSKEFKIDKTLITLLPEWLRNFETNLETMDLKHTIHDLPKIKDSALIVDHSFTGSFEDQIEDLKEYEGTIFACDRALLRLIQCDIIPDYVVNVDSSYLCFPKNTDILCNPNLSSIENIEIGTKVLTHNGVYKNISGIHHRKYRGPIIRILPAYTNIPTEITPEHPILAMKTKRCTPNSNSQTCRETCSRQVWHGCKKLRYQSYTVDWIPAGNLKKGDSVVYPFNTRIQDIKEIKLSDYSKSHRYWQNQMKNYNEAKKLHKKGQGARKIAKNLNLNSWSVGNWIYHNVSPGSKLNLPDNIKINLDFMRFVGYYLAEGSMCLKTGTLEFYFHKKETEYINDVIEVAKKIFELDSHTYTKNNVTAINIHSVSLVQLFDNLFGRHSDKKRVPSWMLELVPEKQAELIKGFWRGDGSIGQQEYTYATTSKLLVYQLRDFLFRLGIIPRIEKKFPRVGGKIEGREIKATIPIYITRISGADRDKFAKIVSYNHEFKPSYTTKHGYIKENYIFIPIKNINLIPFSGNIYNLEVEEDNSYTLLNNICAHNCTSFFDQPEIRKHMSEITAIFAATTFPLTVRTWTGKRVFFTPKMLDFDQLTESISAMSRTDIVRPGGCVHNTSWAIANALGAKTIGLYGIDNSYDSLDQSEEPHTKHTKYFVNELDKSFYTDPVYKLYAEILFQWIEYTKGGVSSVNTTENGIMYNSIAKKMGYDINIKKKALKEFVEGNE